MPLLPDRVPKTMTGTVYNGFGSVQRCSSLPVPPVTRQFPLCIQVCAAGVNPVDAKHVFGDKLPPACPPWFMHRLTQNCIPGFDFSGIVRQVHSSHTTSTTSDDDDDDEETESAYYQVGDWVCGTVPPFTGTFCEYQRVSLDQVTKLPQPPSSTTNAAVAPATTEHDDGTSLSSVVGVPHASLFVTAAALPLIGLTVLQCMEQFHVTSNSRLLVIGASGGTGHFAVQYAKRVLQVPTVVGICSTRNMDWVRTTLGADVVLDYTTSTWKQNLIRYVVDQQDGQPFTHVLDTVTSAKPSDQVMAYEHFVRHERHAVPVSSSSSSEQQQQQEQRYIHLLDPQQGRYVKLGGPTSSWFAAGVKRVCGLNLFWSKQSQLFWVRFPHSSHELQRLVHAAQWAEPQTSNDTTTTITQPVRPVIAQELDYWENHRTTTQDHTDMDTNKDDEEDHVVAKAFSLLHSRRTTGKIVLNFMNKPPVAQTQPPDQF